MAERPLDLVRMVEAMYRFDLPNSAWLRLVAEELGPLVDADRKGQLAMSVVCPDPHGVRAHFRRRVELPEDHVSALAFRFTVAGEPSARSLRLPLQAILRFPLGDSA